MDFARRNKDRILKLWEDGCSSYEIAEDFNTYSNKILRALKFLGREMHDDEDFFKRDYSEAQKLALKKGRSRHPTKGKKLDQSHKDKIGEARSKAYHSLSNTEKKRISEMSRANWEKLTDAKKEEIRSLAMEGVREASRNGSKTERYVANELVRLGYNIETHKGNLVFGSTLEVDIFVPELKTAIEIDGPGHFEPIWGQEKLQKQQASDVAKQGILIGGGYVILRVRQLDRNMSLTKMSKTLQAILVELEAIKDKFPSKKNRLIEIEVHDGEAKRI